MHIPFPGSRSIHTQVFYKFIQENWPSTTWVIVAQVLMYLPAEVQHLQKYTWEIEPAECSLLSTD